MGNSFIFNIIENNYRIFFFKEEPVSHVDELKPKVFNNRTVTVATE